MIPLKVEGNKWFEWRAGTAPGKGVPLRGDEGSAEGLREAVVVLAGMGAVGAVAFITLAKAGVGTLIGVDPDEYGIESYLTQPCRPQDQGMSKALVQGERAHQANPGAYIATFKGFAQDLPLWLLNRADVILIAGDNLELLTWASWVGEGLGKRVIQGATFGEQWLSVVRSFEKSGACPACCISAEDWPRLRSRFGCDPATQRAQGMEPTRTLPNICGTAGDLLASEALKSLFFESEGSEEAAYCLRTHKVWRTTLPRNAGCRCPHESWNVVSLEESSREVTISKLARRLEDSSDLMVRGELPWISFCMCHGCNDYGSIRRFGLPGSTLDACSCGETRLATPAGLQTTLPGKDLMESRDIPLHDMGLPLGAAVALSTGSQWTYFFTNDEPDGQVPAIPANPESGDRK